MARVRGIAVALLVALSCVTGAAGQAQEAADADLLDPQAALAKSRAAVGRSLDAFDFVDQEGRRGSLAAYRGRPLVISTVFTACTVSCPLILQRLAEAVTVARKRPWAPSVSPWSPSGSTPRSTRRHACRPTPGPRVRRWRAGTSSPWRRRRPRA